MSKQPIFAAIFGVPWHTLPPVMQKHYAVCANSADRVVVQGQMRIKSSPLLRLCAPMLRLLGILVPYEGAAAVTVAFYSGQGKDGSNFHFDRIFHFPGKHPYRFHSRLIPLGGNAVIEVMRCGLGWRAQYRASGNHVYLEHIGYALRLGRHLLLPLPLGWLIGRCQAQEEALDDTHFKMAMEIRHPWWGETYRYEGEFVVSDAVDGGRDRCVNPHQPQ